MVKNNKGFTLVLALIILVLLSVMMGLFITMVTVNQRHANRFVARTQIQKIASDGIEYCNRMLICSPEGADWRPVPDNISMTDNWVIGNAENSVNNPAWSIRDDVKAISESDPDYKWLVPYWPKELYTADGVLYAGPDGGYTRMNSGDNRFLVRVTYASVSKDANSDSFVANVYDQSSKYIKIESIARYGNADPDDPTTMKPYKDNTNQYYLLAYKPIGITDYARFITNKDRQKRTFEIGSGIVTENIGRADTRYTKRGGPVRINGNAKFEDVNIHLRALKYDGNYAPRDIVEVTGDLEGENVKVYDEDFNDVTENVNMNDFVRNRNGDDDFLNVIDAPSVDGKTFDRKTLRYRELAKSGKSIYINNTDDVQKESETIYGGYSLRTDWLIPGNRFPGSKWVGFNYIPNGVIIELKPEGVQIEKTDYQVWKDENGVPHPEWPRVRLLKYPENGVIFAEGNIRIKGMLPTETQLTVVSNENIYIEGSILKYRPENTNILQGVDTETYKIADQTSAVSLLARKNVVVNTTMFRTTDMLLGEESDFGGSGEPPFHFVLNPLDRGNYYQCHFRFGPYESEEDLFDGTEWNLAIRHSARGGSVNAFLQSFNYYTNRWKALDWGEDQYSGAPVLTNRIKGSSDLGISGSDDFKYKSDIYKLYKTDFNSDASKNIQINSDQYLKITLGSGSEGEYILGNVAVNPMDVRIEALIYAQNGSFFVIPGYWYETDNSKINDNIWDFGKPLDIRVIVDGTVSENVCAQKSDQISWMEKWGTTYHPDTNKDGSPIEGKGSYHCGAGFTMLYDDTVSYPLTGKEPIRYDEYGRVLPITPCLPVSETLIYKGTAE